MLAERWLVFDFYVGHASICSTLGAFTADRWGDEQAERYLIGLFAGLQTLVDRPELRRPFLEIPP